MSATRIFRENPVRWLVVSALLALPCFLSGCAMMQGLTSFQKPKIRFKEVHIRSLSFSEALLDFDFEVENPNGVGIDLAYFNYGLDVDNKRVVSGKNEERTKIAARGKSPLRVPVTLEFGDVADSLESLFSEKKELAYRLMIGFGVRTPAGIVKVPLNVDGAFPLPRLPKIAVKRVKLRTLSIAGATLEFNISITNPGTVRLPASTLNYQIGIAGSNIATGESAISDIPGQQDHIVTVPLTLQFFRVGHAVVRSLREKEISYRLAGVIHLGTLKKPFEISGKEQL